MRAQDEAEIVACIPSLRRYARGLMSDPDRADDLVQDTLERAWSRFSMWQKRSELRAWMFGIMHNHFIDRIRAQRSRPEDSAGDELPELPQRPQQADALELRDLDRLLQRLPPEQREVLLLVGVEELSYQEVASVTGVPIGTVMSRLSRARARLRDEMAGSGKSQDKVTAATQRIQRVK
ncbi:RNA polymerase sigma-70 factor (ECF subfamily) [Comamonas odontotermitis]|uniref:RNA polymerase sigma-70 factor (ECF subfamily) n=1 Tax=Comamonas odontotermitis TaxID=379895 RepID=A0ABR6RJH6_9BURK|nr:RNA polymerase sigma factor [Comamonas odontotermitis]MBB6579174.1 RNA polymerase sigma-70 factor (ECF subfamily) [Comamonas odontotermitis]